MAVFYIDGQSQGNEQTRGPRSAKLAIAYSESPVIEPKRLKIYWKALGDKTNNEAEYHALLEALSLIEKRWSDKSTGRLPQGADHILIRSDSKLVVYQVRGEWRVEDSKLVPLNSRARESIRRLGSIELGWVPREENYAGLWLEDKLKPLTVERLPS